MQFGNPLGAIAVPIAGRDLFFWPAISGETFPPTLAGAVYASNKNLPCYKASGVGASITWPNMPRISPTGKSNIALTCKFAATQTNTVIFLWGTTPGANVVGFKLESIANGAGYAIQVSASDGSANPANGITDSTVLALDGSWHSLEVDISSAGDITLKRDGNTIGTIAAKFPSSAIMTTLTPSATFTQGGAFITQLQLVWS